MFRTFPQTHYACLALFDSGIIFFFLKQNCSRRAVFTVPHSHPLPLQPSNPPGTTRSLCQGIVTGTGVWRGRMGQLQCECEDTPWRGENQSEMLIFHCQVLLPFQQDQCNGLAIATFHALPAWQHFPIGAVFQSLLYRFLYFKDKRGSACLTYRPGTSPKELKL